MDKTTPISERVKKLDFALNGFSEIQESIKSLKLKDKKDLNAVRSVGSFLNSISEAKEPAFNQTKSYKELKKKAVLRKLREKELEKEKERRILELFTHSSKHSKEFIDPSMLQDQNIKKILKGNKRSFGGYGHHVELPDIKGQKYHRGNLMSDRISNKNLKNILYNNKETSLKKNGPTYYSPRFEEKHPIFEDEKEIDLQIKQRIDSCTLEVGQLKFKLARALIYKVKNI
ncbi:hypothetical protein SteCoe_19222 [Stentor coeruleus]|uniref:Uncharacterized protein n=1 Tax=Stentor coeruleus TaxID=5963 RepID=A0A1R2BVB8_9CILI|nr:hypothetical protein SteCoe_19222 [Stentor coeruleus]